MMDLKDGMLLYHGSYLAIPQIQLNKCVDGLDFGKGFYLTSSYEQAYNYVPMSVRKAVYTGRVDSDFQPENGQISVYRFHSDQNLLIHYFETADQDWLHFVSANRDHSLFPELLKEYALTDIICGKIANDRTARTLQLYISEFFGIPGSLQADKEAIEMLLPDRLQNQFCFRTEDAVKQLEFIRSDRYGNSRP